MLSAARSFHGSPFARSSRLIFALSVMLILCRATTVMPLEFDALVRQSDYVVRAEVTEVESAWEERNGHRVIMTFVTLEVLEQIAGEVPEQPVLQMLGGQVEAQKMTLEGSPQFKVGDEDILFVQGNGRQVSPLTAMMHGRYRIVRDVASKRSYITRENGEPLTDVAEVAQPLRQEHESEQEGPLPAAISQRALSPAAFISRIRAVKPTSEPIANHDQVR